MFFCIFMCIEFICISVTSDLSDVGYSTGVILRIYLRYRCLLSIPLVLLVTISSVVRVVECGWSRCVGMKSLRC